ncbi:MAG: YgiQ family radical protein [Massilia sp.]|nr:YgiQ family radical protein [Massilia sp.]
MGGPTANMYRLACKDKTIEESCRRLSCVYPTICVNLGTDHSKLISLYRKARAIPGIKKVLISSGLRYDLAVRSPEYVKELVTHHVGGLLKIAPEHTEEGTLSKMMKPGIGAYDEFKAMFDKFSLEAGKKQYLIPYFIAAHPGTTDEDMLNLALWLKKNNFKLDQVQTFMPTPMAMATTMYHSRKNPLKKVTADSEIVETAKSGKVRRAHKAFLRYQDPANWPILRETLVKMGRGDLIGNGDRHLVPSWQASEDGGMAAGERKRQTSGAGTLDKFAAAPKRSTARAIAPTPFIAPESKVRPSILATIKTRPKAAAAPAPKGRAGRK